MPHLKEKPVTTVARSDSTQVNISLPPMSVEPEFYLIIWGSIQQDLFQNLWPHFSFISINTLMAKFLKFMAVPALSFFKLCCWELYRKLLQLDGIRRKWKSFKWLLCMSLECTGWHFNTRQCLLSTTVIKSGLVFFPPHMGTEVSNSIDPSAHFSILCTSLFEHTSASKKASMCNSFLAACRTTEPLMWLFDYIWSNSHDRWMMSRLSLWS